MSKAKEKIQINFINLRSSKAIEDFAFKKLKMKENVLDGVESIICNISKQAAKGNEKYSVLIEVHMSNHGFPLREAGNDVYKLIELASDKLQKRLYKIIDKDNEKYVAPDNMDNPLDTLSKSDVEEIETMRVADSSGSSKYAIIERKKYSDNSPMHLEEALQLLELSKKVCILFRNAKNGKYSVVYKIPGKTGYGLIEPKSV